MATLVSNYLPSSISNGQKVSRIDPKIAMETIRFLPTSPNSGLISPSYPKTPSKVNLSERYVKSVSPINTQVKGSVQIPIKIEQSPSVLNYGVVDGESDIPKPVEENFLEVKKRADYRVKFSILREAYPQMSIPEPEENQTIDEIEVIYRQYIKRIHIDSSVDQNQIYLLILWMVMEIVGGRFLKLPIRGFTKNQFNYMTKYRMLLIELGERSYSSGMGEGWPVELRILALAAFNAVIFVLVHLLAGKIGVAGNGADKMAEELREMITNFLTQNKGNDVLRRAEEATSDNPPPPAVAQDNSPPLGGMGGMLASLASMFAGGSSETNATPAPKAEIKKPTTFGSRRPRPTQDST
jgi:hypothetical protein